MKEARTNYHGNVASICELLGWLEIQEGRKVVCMLKIQLVKAADSGEKHAVLKLLHVAPRLAHHGWVCRRVIFERERL